jgi:hypothetical protein
LNDYVLSKRILALTFTLLLKTWIHKRAIVRREKVAIIRGLVVQLKAVKKRRVLQIFHMASNR